MCVITDGSENRIPEGSEIISDNSIAIVWRSPDGLIYKRSMPFLIENEIYCLRVLWPSGYVPQAYRHDKYTIAMRDLGDTEPVTDKDRFVVGMHGIATALVRNKIRHGDITKYAIIVKDNDPYIIDFAESRLESDPRPDKRIEGDDYWIKKTIEELTNGI